MHVLRSLLTRFLKHTALRQNRPGDFVVTWPLPSFDFKSPPCLRPSLRTPRKPMLDALMQRFSTAGTRPGTGT